MRRRAVKLILGAALAASAVAGGAAYQGPPQRRSDETRIVPPLADPALVPGVARCTSDGVCTVTDALGTRAASRLVTR